MHSAPRVPIQGKVARGFLLHRVRARPYRARSGNVVMSMWPQILGVAIEGPARGKSMTAPFALNTQFAGTAASRQRSSPEIRVPSGLSTARP